MECFKCNNLEYAVRYPKNFDESQKYPAILFLHGAGTRWVPADKMDACSIFTATNNMEDFPFILIAPVCHQETWFDVFADLKELVKQIAEMPFVDSSRLYLTGNSMGGYGSWQLGMSLHQYFAAIVPICGGGMYWNVHRLKSVPVWAFHGEKDYTVLPRESEVLVNRLNDYGGNAKLTIYPDCEHDSWTRTYQNPDLYKWLLEQKKN